MGNTQEQQSGFGFPMIAKGLHGRVNYVQGDSVTLIKASLRQILLTAPGERMWNPEFGCRVKELLFDTFSPTLKTTMANLALEAIRRWEDRVSVNTGDIAVIASTGSPTSIELRVSFRVKNPDFTAQPNLTISVSFNI